MTLHSGTLSRGRPPFWRRQQFWRVTLPIVAVAAAALAGVLVYNAFYGSNGLPNAKNGWGVTYPVAKEPATVKLDASIKPMMLRFIQTAVARKNLDVAYDLSGPQIRQGMTRKQFEAGAIAVVPFKITDKTKITVKVLKSYATSAQLQYFLVTPGSTDNKNSPHTYFADLIKSHGRWYVNSWVPRWTPPIPTQPGR